MGIGESIRLALEGLRVNKMRSVLTMLGIIIGISSVIGILTIGKGLTTSVTVSLGSLGANNINVFLQAQEDDSAAISLNSGGNKITDKDLITDEMLEKLQNRYKTDITGIGLNESAGTGKVQDGRFYANVSLSGVNDEFLTLNNVEMLSGRAIRPEDVDGRRNVCVVSDKLVNNLYQGNIDAALGDEIKVEVKGSIRDFRIVGVYKYVSYSSTPNASEKDIVTALYLPVSTAKQITGGAAGYSSLLVQVSTNSDINMITPEIQNFLNQYYVNNRDFSVAAFATSSLVESVTGTIKGISSAISITAAISLLVGGIGVMNIMLVSVTERTREIGVRKALGATNNDIRIQFVVESIIVCLVGGMIGILIGALLGYVGSSLLASAVTKGASTEGSLPQFSYVILAVGFSMGIGVFFGYYPANKAAKLDPIEALRYE